MTGPYDPGHKHRYGSWTLQRSPVKPRDELNDDEYVKAIMLDPMWVQSCECGFRNMVRRSTKPNARFKFNDHWNSKRY